MASLWKKFSFGRISFSRRNVRRITNEIDPDTILLDSHNIPQFDTHQFEGRLEKPISRFTLYTVGGIFFIVLLVFLAQSWKLQIVQGEEYRERSEQNSLRPIPVFAGRGVIFDRNENLLAWNAPGEGEVAERRYSTSTGLSHVIGYVQYPSKDAQGFYYQEDFEGVDGAEKYFNPLLQGENGSRLVEVDARNNIISESVVRPATQGSNLTLSIDSRVQSALHNNIKDIAQRVGFTGGAGVIMDVETGELLALTSYPEYEMQVMSDKSDSDKVRSLLVDPGLPFLNRAVNGLYTPGSIIKPFMAIAALTEKVIEPSTVIISSGSISIPNPWDPELSTIFRDWKAHGPVNMRQAISVSSDVYFYVVGGGYKDQKGLGIARIDKYLQMFGLGVLMSESFVQGKAGTVPTPDWKKKTFDEDWYVGDTYNTSIGQYGFQVTPVQAVRAIAAVANGGKLFTPTIIKGENAQLDYTVDVPQSYFKIVQEGMRMSVTEGTSKALNVPYVHIAGKSGTAELGVAKDKVNSWITGYWPYENPKYAFAVLLERGSVHNLIGAAAAFRQQLDWMSLNTPEYFKN